MPPFSILFSIIATRTFQQWVHRESVTRCPESGPASFLTGRLRHSISGRMNLARAATSAKIDASALVRATGVKFAFKVTPGVCNVGKLEAYKCFPLPSGRPGDISRFDGSRRTSSSQINKTLEL